MIVNHLHRLARHFANFRSIGHTNQYARSVRFRVFGVLRERARHLVHLRRRHTINIECRFNDKRSNLSPACFRERQSMGDGSVR
jgi:hypothetical protein